MKFVCHVLAAICLLTTPGFAAEWFPFQPQREFPADSPLDLRQLNERFAGEHGFIEARAGKFVQRDNGEPVRFWAVNGPPEGLHGDELRHCARMLARYGVNMVRMHGAVFDKRGEVDIAKIQHALEVVAAMKAEGIYTHFSIYFPLWFRPPADLDWLPGYDGNQHPFAALQFHPKFQEKYRSWLQALLTTPDQTGRTLLTEPAVFGIELQNEDSFFFWTFNPQNIPEPQLQLLESQFGAWLAAKYGSADKALAAWNSPALPRDQPTAPRMTFRPLWNIAHEKTPRDRDTAAFLFETQSKFYREQMQFLRALGFQGLIHCSNWHTASPEILGPLEKLSYTAGDFIDRHGYFECNHKGENAAWSIRPEHTFSQRSALRFDAVTPGKPRQFVHPVMDVQYDEKPSMISETTFTRPNRYRSEAPLYFAAYGALQDSDAIVHFAFDGDRWQVKPRFWMQQWTLATPAMLGQFPAAALIYRRGLIAEGDVVASVQLNREAVLNLQGTPLPQDAAFDELRLADVPAGHEFQPGQRLDPLLHFAGRTRVEFTTQPSRVHLVDTARLIDRQQQTVTSTTGELQLDYGRGLLTLNAPQVQGASGNLQAAGVISLTDVRLSSELDLAHMVVVSLDGQPLAKSRRMLLQVMSEEQPTDFATQPVDDATLHITNIGRDPWLVRSLQGTVALTRNDARQLQVTALDANGQTVQRVGTADNCELLPTTLYYLIAP